MGRVIGIVIINTIDKGRGNEIKRNENTMECGGFYEVVTSNTVVGCGQIQYYFQYQYQYPYSISISKFKAAKVNEMRKSFNHRSNHVHGVFGEQMVHLELSWRWFVR